MKHGIGLAWVVVALIFAFPVIAGEAAWMEQPSFDELLEKAKTENKYIMIDFYTVWCSPCKKLDKETYTDAKVVEFLNGLLPVKYDSEKGEGIKVSRKFRVNSWPTQILLTPDGKEAGRYIGFLQAADFLKVMGDYKKGLGTIAHYEEKAKKNPDDPIVWKTLGTMYADAREADKATRALNRYLEVAESPSRDEVAAARFTIGYVNYSTKSYDKARGLLEEFVGEYSDTEYYDEASVMLAKSYHHTGDDKKCIATYLAFVDRHPGDPAAMNSFAWFAATNDVGHDEALPLAIKMVELAERHPGYLDTLAELYYARGEYDLAVEIGAEAAKKEPDDKYFADQLDKFKKAKAEAGSRASG